MGSDDNSNLGIQQRGESLLNCSSSGIYTNPPSVKIVKNNVLNSMSLCESSSGVESFFGTGWDPILSLAHNGEFTGTSMASQNHPNQNSLSPYGVYENQGVSSTSQIVQYPNNPRLVDLTPKFPTFGSRNYSEMVSSVTLPEETQMINGGPSTFNKEGIAANSRNSSPDGKKRKRLPDHHTGKTHHSQFNCNENEAEEDQQKDISDGTLNSNEENENISKSGKIVTVISRANQNGKQAKDSSPDGQDPKEDYIHIRAKRGQATNSHSLAERVRREKISERMKLLQDLVPGCNKITGKAVMLDEIINYVQSLQQQVEFLSMKLATVNPELNFNIDQILSKDVLHSRALGSSILGFAPGVTPTFPLPVTNQHGAMQAMLCTDSQAPNTWHDELQTMIQMGFIPNQVLDSMGLNGHTKAEL